MNAAARNAREEHRKQRVMPQRTWFLILFIGVDLLIAVVVVIALTHSTRGTFDKLAARFPPVEPEPDAITRRFRGFRLNWFNAGFSAHMTADALHLHIKPVGPVRWFGARALSIPWDAMQNPRKAWWAMRTTVAGESLDLPLWCLRMVTPDEGDAR